MRKQDSVLGYAELEILANSIGAHWQYIAGADLSPDMHSPLSVVVVTDRGPLTVTSHTEEFDFEGQPTDYAVLSVVDHAVDWETAKRRGNVYVHHQGVVIEDVYVLRETITESQGEKASWSYTSDIAIIFELVDSAIAIGKVSHHTEMLGVYSAGSAGTLEIPDRSIEWMDELGIEHSSVRQLCRITDLIS